MPYRFKEIERKLKKLGFCISRQAGSHVIFVKDSTIIPVPNHPGKDISPGVESTIIKRCGLTRESFKRLK
jgi:predicted RNA binding protein YcfA (HicA-like mRNA interferase family)